MGRETGSSRGGEAEASTDTRPRCPGPRAPEGFELVLDLVLCGVLIAGVTYCAHRLQPDFRGSRCIGLTAGGLCLLCGLCGLRGSAVRDRDGNPRDRRGC
jgi:hypothetical protein